LKRKKVPKASCFSLFSVLFLVEISGIEPLSFCGMPQKPPLAAENLIKIFKRGSGSESKTKKTGASPVFFLWWR
ncbi:MAG: hypothetical protein KIG31_00810, partial [Oscillospiraceae bacterium]|nr:hypothetical protein [Oscillospiraceae bacterium]